MLSREDFPKILPFYNKNQLREKELATLLKKQVNPNVLVKNIFNEVGEFLYVNGLDYDVCKADMPFKLLDILNIGDRKVSLAVVDDYSKFNSRVLNKDFVWKVHQGFSKEGYRTIWIKRFEWEDLRKRNVLCSLIIHACNRTPTHVFARNTVAEIISSKDLRDFFNFSSFYGYRNAHFAACLRQKKDNRIVMAMSFGHPYYGQSMYGEHAVECIRAASLPNTIVVGGMSKLMGFILKTFSNEFDKIVYYVDDAHYGCGSMNSIGFKFSHFAAGGTHNVWAETGSMFMRTPALHREIMYMIREGHILAIPDVGNSTFVYTKDNQV